MIDFILMLVITAIVIDFGLRVFLYARCQDSKYKHEHFAIIKNYYKGELK